MSQFLSPVIRPAQGRQVDSKTVVIEKVEKRPTVKEKGRVLDDQKLISMADKMQRVHSNSSSRFQCQCSI